MADWLPLLKLDEPLTVENAAGVVARVVEALATDPAYGYPGGFEGRGIVTCAGGGKYLPCAWVLVRMLRHLGCPLPIECWHLGPEEIPAEWRGLFTPYDVTFVDGREVAQRHPHPRLNGWELKPYAIRFSRFREVLFLDADNVPVYDPSAVFAWPEYAAQGAMFWPDRGFLAAVHPAWRIFGEIAPRREREFETGQVLVDKARIWGPLLLTNWYNVHSPFFYRHVHGDKETFHLAWRRWGAEYAMPAQGPRDVGRALYQHDFAGARIWQHRGGAKWSLRHNSRLYDFRFEDECREWLEELVVARDPTPAWQAMEPSDRLLADGLCGREFEYCRLGIDERTLKLGAGGWISAGGDHCEDSWYVAQGQLVVVAEDGRVTCRLARDQWGVWRGRWEHHERMPIRLLPLGERPVEERRPETMTG